MKAFFISMDAVLAIAIATLFLTVSFYLISYSHHSSLNLFFYSRDAFIVGSNFDFENEDFYLGSENCKNAKDTAAFTNLYWDGSQLKANITVVCYR
ncbi:MAG: hypothetical protein QW097_02570 [archaeon]